MTKLLAACLMLAAQTYSVPPAVLVGIHQVEGGKVGQAVGPNDNGSYDLGPMQINTIWIPELAQVEPGRYQAIIQQITFAGS